MKFLLEYIKHPTKVGAVAPSSKRLARKMVEEVDFRYLDCIVEFGPGTGVFTKEILKRKEKNTVLILIEQNEKFFTLLSNKYAHLDNVKIFNDSAENVEKILKKCGFKQTSYIISGLPFTSFKKSLTDKILKATSKVIGKDGRFITFQYTMIKEKTFEKHLKIVGKKHINLNVPPAYVLTMKNK